MPVEDHPVHARTVMAADARYGCHSSKRPNGISPGYWAPDGYKMAQVNQDGHKIVLPLMRWIPHVMSTDCKYDKLGDPLCLGCEQAKIVDINK